jgi:hypothetical protein
MPTFLNFFQTKRMNQVKSFWLLAMVCVLCLASESVDEDGNTGGEPSSSRQPSASKSDGAYRGGRHRRNRHRSASQTEHDPSQLQEFVASSSKQEDSETTPDRPLSRGTLSPSASRPYLFDDHDEHLRDLHKEDEGRPVQDNPQGKDSDGVDGETHGHWTTRVARRKFGTFGPPVMEKVWDGRHHHHEIREHQRAESKRHRDRARRQLSQGSHEKHRRRTESLRTLHELRMKNHEGDRGQESSEF